MRRTPLIVIAALAATPAAGQESLPFKTVSAITEATVLISTTSGADRSNGGTGSGFVIRVEGQTAYIATNNHVVSPHNGLARERVSVTVVIRCGAKAERKLSAEIVAASPESDLAILKISGLPDFPVPIDIFKETKPIKILWPSRLKIGLDAINTSSGPLSVRFEEYTSGKPGTTTAK